MKGQAYNKEVLLAGLNHILWKYNKADVVISKLHADNEFKSVMEDLDEKWELDVNLAHPRDHVPDIERESRTSQERFRVNLYRLPFKAIPRTMIHYLVLHVTKNWSLFPRETSI